MDTLIELLPLPYTDAVVVVGAATLGLVAGVLGTFAVLRERSLVGDALAHAALPGVSIAFLVTGAKDASTLLVGAALAGAMGAVMMLGIERTRRIKPDAAIGVVLSSFFALGIVLLTHIGSRPDADQAGLERYLFGQAAGLVERDLTVMAALALAALLAVWLGFRALKTTLFDQGFAGSVGLPVRALELAATVMLVVAIVIGLRTVGAILMVSMLIVPAAAARQLTGRLAPMLGLAGLLGAAVGVTGSLLSANASLPTGPVIVLVGFGVVLACLLFAPRRGVMWRARALARERRRTLVEGVLAELESALHAGPPPTEEDLVLTTGRSRRTLRRGLSDLDRAGLLAGEDGRLRLTESGAAAAHLMLARRDLWSAWLEHGWQLDLADAREPDPRDLVGSLGGEAVDRLRSLATAEPR